MNKLNDFRIELKSLAYDQNQLFRKSFNWKVWAFVDSKIQIPKGRFFRDAERIIWRTF